MKKILTCIASVVPLLGMGIGAIMAFGSIIFLGEMMEDPVTTVLYFLGLAIMMIGGLMCWVDIVWFIVIAVKNKKLSDMQKLVWGIVLYMVNVLAFPVFWFMVIRKEE